MPLIQSLFCLHGFDNRTRFYSIILMCYFSFILLNALVNNSLFSLLILFFTSYIAALSTIRRLKDAQLKKAWLLLSVGSYLLSGLLIIWIDNSYVNWLIVIPLLISALLLTYPSTQNKNYILGYSGPIDLTTYENNYPQQRIEPVLDNTVSNQQTAAVFDEQPLFNSQTFNQQASVNTNSVHKNDQGELLREKLVQHSKKLTVGLVLFFALVVLLALFSTQKTLKPDIATEQTINSSAAKTEIAMLARLAPVTLPDNFTLMLSQYNGVIIHWQAEENNETKLWSIVTAEGRDNCNSLIFNNKEYYRSLAVIVENNRDHYAYFSPLDTEKLLKAIALGNSFSICAFKFSLKGSQAALGKNPVYADFITY
jgi:uncharacterized membrane protein YhaH (DUF805 family)